MKKWFHSKATVSCREEEMVTLEECVSELKKSVESLKLEILKGLRLEPEYIKKKEAALEEEENAKINAAIQILHENGMEIKLIINNGVNSAGWVEIFAVTANGRTFFVTSDLKLREVE